LPMSGTFSTSRFCAPCAASPPITATSLRPICPPVAVPA
jgi:hypothetical protein